MRISKEQLQKIIAEEVRAHVKKKLVTESVSEPRTVKATPAMLKSIIAEEAAKINEASSGGGYSYGPAFGQGAKSVSQGHRAPLPDYHEHPDNRGVDYEPVDALEDDYAKEAARRELELKNRRYLMTSNFAKAIHSNTSILVDVKTKKIICDLAKYNSLTKDIFKKLNEEGVPQLLFRNPKAYQSILFNILNSHRADGKKLAGEELFSGDNTAIASIHLIHEVLGIEIEKEEDILSIRYEEYNNLYK